MIHTRTLSRGAGTLAAILLLSSTIYSAPPLGQTAVTIATPPPFSKLQIHKVLTVKANVVDANPAKVDFYVNQVFVGTDKSSPFGVNWAPPRIGTYTLTAVVTSKSGGRAVSAPTLINAVTSLAAPASKPAAAPASQPAPTPAPAPAPAPQPKPTLPANVSVPTGQPLLRQSALVYEGAFRAPKGLLSGPIAYNAANKTMYVTNQLTRMVAEVTVPAPLVTSDANELPVATLVQPAADVFDGKRLTIDGDIVNGVNVGGLLPYKGKLYATAYSYYDALGKQTLSHFVSNTNLALTTDAQGPYRIDAPKAGYVSGYMTPIPTAWQAALGGPVLNGNCCVSIISRTSYGPAAFAIDPTQIGASAAAPATPLIYYTPTNPLGAFNGTNQYFNGSTDVVGVAFPEGTRSVLFVGSHGVGAYCYGTGVECNDPAIASKGNHAYPYKYYVWAYDAADLALVRAGKLDPWVVKPYEIWSMTPSFAHPTALVYGSTFDPATNRLYIAQATTTVGPIVQVYRLKP
jgi:hypothetical protein